MDINDIKHNFPHLVAYLSDLYRSAFEQLHKSNTIDPKDVSYEIFCADYSSGILQRFIDQIPYVFDIHLWKGLSRWESPNNKTLAYKSIRPSALLKKLEKSKEKYELDLLLAERRKSHNVVSVDISDQSMQLLRWLDKARATEDNRPALNGFYFNDHKIVTANGYVLHSAPMPEDLLTIEGLYYIVFLKNSIELWPMLDCRFPDILSLCPRHMCDIDEICLDSSFLKDTISMIDPHSLRISFSGAMSPVIVQGNVNGIGVYALIMPMSSSRDIKTYWQPF